MRTHMTDIYARTILAERYKAAGYDGVAEGVVDGGRAANFPSTLAILEAMRRAYDLGVSSMLRVTEKN